MKKNKALKSVSSQEIGMHKTSGMKFFGESWGAAICLDSENVPTPVGTPCGCCGELFEEGDQGIIDCGGFTEHLNCFLRGIFGSVAHIEKRCSCYIPGATCTDPPEMTKREAATAAVRAFYKMERGEAYANGDAVRDDQVDNRDAGDRAGK